MRQQIFFEMADLFKDPSEKRRADVRLIQTADRARDRSPSVTSALSARSRTQVSAKTTPFYGTLQFMSEGLSK